MLLLYVKKPSINTVIRSIRNHCSSEEESCHAGNDMVMTDGWLELVVKHSDAITKLTRKKAHKAHPKPIRWAIAQSPIQTDWSFNHRYMHATVPNDKPCSSLICHRCCYLLRVSQVDDQSQVIYDPTTKLERQPTRPSLSQKTRKIGHYNYRLAQCLSSRSAASSRDCKRKNHKEPVQHYHMGKQHVLPRGSLKNIKHLWNNTHLRNLGLCLMTNPSWL